MSESAASVGPVSVPEERTSERGLCHGRAAELIRSHAWTLTVWAAMAVWAGVVLAIAVDRQAEFRFARYDLGNMTQAVWSAANGHWLEVTQGETGEQLVRLGLHVDPILALLAPAWLIFPSPLALIAVQVLMVALGALPVYWLARRHCGSARLGGLLALTYLAYPWIAWNALDVFHPVALAIPLFLFCVWFLDTERLVPFAVCALLAAGTSELMALSVAALGIWYAVARGHRRAGAFIAILAVAWTVVAVNVVVPAYSGGESLFFGAYENVGGSPTGVVRTAVTDPLAIVSAVMQGRDLAYLLLLSAPLAGLFVLAPGIALVALPQLAANVLADREHTTDPHVHYVAAIVPFLFAAVAIGLARLSPVGRARAVAVALTASIAATIAVGPWPRSLLGASNWDTLGTLDTSPRHVAALEQAVSLVPDAAAVSSTNRVGSHLSARRYIYSAPVLGRADWVVADSTDTWVPAGHGGLADPEAVADFLTRLERDANWREIYSVDGVLVFRRVGR